MPAHPPVASSPKLGQRVRKRCFLWSPDIQPFLGYHVPRGSITEDTHMKKLTTDSKQLGALRMLDEFVQSLDLGLSDQTAPDEFIKKLAAALQEHRSNPIVV